MPSQLYEIFTLAEHYVGGHMGIARTYKGLDAKYAILEKTKLKTVVEELISSCIPCRLTEANTSRKKLAGSFQRLAPNRLWVMDLIELASDKNILCIVDAFSLFLITSSLGRKTQSKIKTAVNTAIGILGRPDMILTDNASIFTGESMRKFYAQNNIIKKDSSPYHSIARSIVERLNRSIEELITKYSHPQTGYLFEDTLGLVTFILNQRISAYHPYITPSSLMGIYPREARVKLRYEDSNREVTVPEKLEYVKQIDEIVNTVIEKYNYEKEKKKAKVNQKRIPSQFLVGDYVWILRRSTPIGVSRKVRGKYLSQPFQIVKIANNHLVYLEAK